MTVSVIHPAPLVEASARCLSIGVKAEIEIGQVGCLPWERAQAAIGRRWDKAALLSFLIWDHPLL